MDQGKLSDSHLNGVSTGPSLSMYPGKLSDFLLE